MMALRFFIAAFLCAMMLLQVTAPHNELHGNGLGVDEVSENMVDGSEASIPGAADVVEEVSTPGKHGPGNNLGQSVASSPLRTTSSAKSIPGLGEWSFRDAHNIDDAEALGYDGTGVLVGIADTGVDFCKAELTDALTTVGNLTVENQTLVKTASEGLSSAFLSVNGEVISLEVYINSTKLNPSEYTYNATSGEIALAQPLEYGRCVNVTYSYTPTNYGWPLVLDVRSLREYVARGEVSDTSWYADTSAIGYVDNGTGDPPTFEYYHFPEFAMSGKDFDFNDLDARFTDLVTVLNNGQFWDGESWQTTTEDFDLKKLHVSRDHDNWYFGFDSTRSQLNKTFGLYIDFDNVTGGAGIYPGGEADPHGYPVDAESSHSGSVSSIDYHAGNGKLVSCSSGQETGADNDNVFVWAGTGELEGVFTGPAQQVEEVEWLTFDLFIGSSKDGKLYLWSLGGGNLVNSRSLTSQGLGDTISFDGANVFVARGNNGVSNFTVADFISKPGTWFSNPIPGMATSVSVSPAGSLIAVGLGNGSINIHDNAAPYALLTHLPSETGGNSQGHDPTTAVRRLAWSPDGLRLATGGDDGRMFVWDATAGNILQAWNDIQNPAITQVANYAIGGILWSNSNIVVGGVNGALIVIDTVTYATMDTVGLMNDQPVTALGYGTTTLDIYAGSGDTTIRLFDLNAPDPAADYAPLLLHKPDVIVYVPFVAEKYRIDEDGFHSISEPDGIEDPYVYFWDAVNGTWNMTRLSDHGGELHAYKGNKEVSDTAEITVKGFAEIALPRSITDKFGTNGISVELFIAGEEPTVVQDTVPTDHNVQFTQTDLSTDRVRSLSSFGYVAFPETTIDLPLGLRSMSGIYHYGFHPSEALDTVVNERIPGNYVGVLVVDTVEPGVYDTVIADINEYTEPNLGIIVPNYIFEATDPRATKDSPFLSVDIMDTTRTTFAPDGIPDYSAGIVTYISNGEHRLPYSDRIAELEVIRLDPTDHPMPIPGNGDLVCFFGEFDMLSMPDGSEQPETRGTIAATAIAGRGNVADPQGFGNMTGAAKGVKLIATGRTADYLGSSLHFLVEGFDMTPLTEDDASVIYVGTVGPSYSGGLDSNSHLIDYFAADYLDNEVTFVLPAGNDGPGLGTINSPAPHNAIIVGGARDNAYDGEGPVHMFGDIAEYSSRGPTAAGAIKPDVVAVGSGRVTLPLSFYNVPGGNDANFATLEDTMLSASITTGVAAIVHQAYGITHGGAAPDKDVTANTIRSSAVDRGYDVLTQGAGFLDALGAVDIALGSGGMLLESMTFEPSNYWETSYSGFPNLMEAGTSVYTSIDMMNYEGATNLSVSAEHHVPIWEHDIDIGVVQPSSMYLLNLTDLIPFDVSLLRLSATSNADEFYDVEMNTQIDLKRVAVFADWAGGRYGIEPNSNEINIVSEAEVSEDTATVQSNVVDLEVGQPHRRYQSNLWFMMETDSSNNVNWTLHLTGYSNEPWDWINLSGVPSNIGAGASTSIGMMMTVPDSVTPGSYSGSIRILCSIQSLTETVYGPTDANNTNRYINELNITVGSQVGNLSADKVLPGIVNGSEELIRTRKVDFDGNVYITDGTEPGEPDPWGFFLPYAPVISGTPDTIMYYYSTLYDYTLTFEDLGKELGTDYEINMTTGFVTMYFNLFDETGDPVVLINATYTYHFSTVLASPSDYMLFSNNGTVLLTTPYSAVDVNITVNYTRIIRVKLTEYELLSISVSSYDNGTGLETILPPAAYSVYLEIGILDIYDHIQTGVTLNVTYTYYSGKVVAPILVNVGAATTAYYEFGGVANLSINSPTTLFGGYGSSIYAGDRRYYYVHIPEQGLFVNKESFRTIVSVKWDSIPADVDIAVFGVSDAGPTLSGDVAPYYLMEIGKGPPAPTDKPLNFTTTSGGPNETLIFNFEPGLNVICLKAKMLCGNTNAQPFTATGGWVWASGGGAPRRSTNSLTGQMSVDVMSNTALDEGLYASVVGPAVAKVYKNEEVWQDEIFHDVTQEDWWTINSNAQYIKEIDVSEGTLSLDVRIIGDETCPDLDLCLFYDGKNGQEDGVAQWDEFIDKSVCDGIDNYGNPGANPLYAYSAGAGSDEATKVLRPKPGMWLVKVVGYQVSGSPGHFDLIVKKIQAGLKGYELDSNLPDNNPAENVVVHNHKVPRFHQNRFDIHWELPERTAEDGSYSGILSFGNLYSPGLLPVPVDIYLDRVAPVHVQVLPVPGSVTANPEESVVCIFSEESGEFDGDSVQVIIDGEDVSSRVEVSAKQTADSNGKQGYWGGSAVFNPPTLADGGHLVTVSSKDFAGNMATTSFGFTVDTKKPVVTLDGLSDIVYTNQASYEVSGKTETDSAVNVLLGTVAAEVKRAPTGVFRATVELEEGDNILMVNATDGAGNEERRTFTIVRDSVSPAFERVICQDGTLTNRASTMISGSVNEPVALRINGSPETVNSDGTFKASVHLTEGEDAFDLEIMDLAGNSVNGWLNLTLDTQPPVVILDDTPDIVDEGQINITGSVEVGSIITINGKPVRVEGSRQQTGSFGKLVTLSPGPNTLVIEARDQAGNSEVLHVGIEYEETVGTNYGVIGLMVVLLVIGLFLGLLFARFIFGKKSTEEDEDLEEDLDGDIEDEDLAFDLEGGEEPEVAGITETDGQETEAVPEQLEVDETVEPDKAEVSEEPVEVIPSERTDIDEENPKVMKLKQAYEDGKLSKELYEKNLRKLRDQ
jgi:WD40 repeat protein